MNKNAWIAVLMGLGIGLILMGFTVLFKVHAATYPAYQGYVTDQAKTLTTEEVEKLEKKLTEYDHQTTNQIAVFLVKTTGPETIEQYSINVAEQWKIGQKGQDNGILMLFAMDDHKMRIEVGRGLEGSLTDVQSKHIIDNTISPEFKNKNYYAGIDKGIDQIMIAVSPDSPIASVAAKAASDSAVAGAVVLIIIILVVIIILIAMSPYTPLGGEGTWGVTSVWKSNSDSGDGFGGFGGGSFSGGGASGSW
jgi:uncharacterized protein